MVFFFCEYSVWWEVLEILEVIAIFGIDGLKVVGILLVSASVVV